MTGAPEDGGSLDSFVKAADERPDSVALLCDLDGTLAPIASRPEQASVPETTRERLSACAHKLGLVAVVTGRQALEARGMVGLDSIAYRGNHGLESLDADTDAVEPHPEIRGIENEAANFVASLDSDELSDLGIRVEDKGPITALHWRGSDREGEAEEVANSIGDRARAAGLFPRPGRMVLELRPTDSVDKGVAVDGLLSERDDLTHALFVGDDLTDLDAFEALDELVERGDLDTGLKVAVESGEASASRLVAAADCCVDGPERVTDLLARLSG